MSKALGVCLLLIGVQTIYTVATDLNACIEADNGTSTPGLVLLNPETGDMIHGQHIIEDYDTHQIQEYTYQGVGCDCKERLCQCCVEFNVKWLPTSLACVQVIYLSNISSMEATFLMNNKEVMSKTFPVDKPVPLCISIPYVPGGNVCARVHDIALSGPWSSKACVDLEIWIFGTTVYKMEFNCFHLGSVNAEIDDY